MARKLAVIMHAMWRDGTVYADAVETGDGDGGATAKERKLLGAYA